MLHRLPLSLLYLLALTTVRRTSALPGLSYDSWNIRAGLSSLLPRSRSTGGQLETNANGSSFIWAIDDTYQGSTFFDGFGFFGDTDPTHGTVKFLDQADAWNQGLVSIKDDGTVIMKADDTSTLPLGVNRSSVRISSTKQYNTGLFILDLNQAPWGCGVWPAFWTVGGGAWPQTGEIDIIEGVHDNEHNQITWHTGSGCELNPNASFTGTVVQTNGANNTNCDGNAPGNAGCGITEWSRASYGPYFDSQGGGVFAMKWDEEGIAVYSFYRAAIPSDIVQGSPDPSGWGVPDAQLDPSGCDPLKFFVNHSIIFDITFCGDWAGNSYATSGCPGTCANQLMDPANFVNASWSINWLKTYKKTTLTGTVSGAPRLLAHEFAGIFSCLAVLAGLMLAGIL